MPLLVKYVADGTAEAFADPKIAAAASKQIKYPL